MMKMEYYTNRYKYSDVLYEPVEILYEYGVFHMNQNKYSYTKFHEHVFSH